MKYDILATLHHSTHVTIEADSLEEAFNKVGNLSCSKLYVEVGKIMKDMDIPGVVTVKEVNKDGSPEYINVGIDKYLDMTTCEEQ